MKKRKLILTSGFLSAFWLILTGWLAYGVDTPLFDFSFLFHLIPWGIGFSEGTTIFFYLAYLLTWFVLSLIAIPIVIVISLTFKKLRLLK